MRHAWSMVLVCAALVTEACVRPAGPVVIGCVVPDWGAPVARLVAQELATDPVQPRIELACDTTAGAAPDGALADAEGIVATPGLVGVVGHAGSRESLLAAPIYEEAHVAQVVPTGTSRHLTAAGPWIFPIAPNDSVESAFIASYVDDSLAARSATIMYTNDDYGVGIADGAANALARRRVQIRSRIPIGPRSDLDALLRAEISLRRPDVLIIATGAPAAARIARIVDTLAPTLPIVAADGAAIVPELPASLAGASASHLSLVTFWSPDASDSASRAFVEAFRAVAHTDPHASQAMTYDALHLLIDAIRTSGGTPRAIRAYLRSLGRSVPPFAGITGPIAFDGNDDSTRLVITHLEGGRLVRGGVR